VNYYITSERYLDEQMRNHPRETHGGNGRDRYADVATVRTRPEGIAGAETLLRETCARYDVPVAITEAHLGCTRDEQLRWLKEIWEAAQTVRREGRNVCAVTAWSLLGAYDWDSLLTRADNHYEPGAFDISSGTPRPTAVAKMLRAFGHNERFDHPVLHARGWWRRSIRLETENDCPTRSTAAHATPHTRRSKTILITGGAGRLGRAFNWAADVRALACCPLTHRELDIADPAAVARTLEELAPWAVINCAGFSSVDGAESDQPGCMRANVDGAEILARACATRAVPFLTFSSDFVFDGQKHGPYLESDAVDPLNLYGESKAIAESRVFAAHPRALVIRCGKVFAPLEPVDFLRDDLEALARGERVILPNDTRFSATHLLDLVTAALDLLIDEENGVWHLANSGAVTHEELLVRAAELAELDTTLIKGVPAWSLRRRALQPRNRALASERGQLLPPLGEALERFVTDAQPLLDAAARAMAIR
jgi:dTDP-4-dehydrorhamnose reductase